MMFFGERDRVKLVFVSELITTQRPTRSLFHTGDNGDVETKDAVYKRHRR